MLEPLSRNTLTKLAIDTLRRFILTEDLQTGDQLPSERELSENLSVSRNIVREALSVLVAEGLIVKHPGRGIFVAEFDRNQIMPQLTVSIDYNGRNIVAIGEARAAMELGAIGLIARRITDAQINQLEQLNRSFEDNLRHHRSTIKDDINFHKILIESTQNQMLIGMIPLLTEHFRLSVLHRPAAIFRNPDRIVGEHQRIITALRARDPSAARVALIEHLHLPDIES